MATLFNTKISETYEGLIKTSDNGVIGAVEKNLTDGLGNASTFSIGTSTASFTGTLDLTNATVLGLSTGAVDSVNGLTGVVVLTTTNIAEGTNLYFTDARVESNSAVTLNTAKVGITTSQANAIVANTLKVSFPEAPNDGQQYARQSQAWAVVSGGGAVSSVTGSGTVSGLTLTTGGTSTDPILTLGGTLSLTSANVTDGLGFTPYNSTNPDNYDTTPSWVPSADPNYLTGITSSQVTTALGFTPYNATNPSNFTSNLGIVQSVTGNAGSLEIVSGVLNVPPSAAAPVDSVNGATGVVVLDTDDIAEGTTNKYMVLGTTAGTALEGNTTTITTQQATDITNNNTKVGISTQQTTDITNNNTKISFTSTGADNYLSKWDSNTLVDSIAYSDTNGIGIGTTTPSAKLEVKGDGDAIIVINDTDNPQLIFKESDTTKGKIYSNGQTLGELLFDIGTTNRMRLNSNGLSILGDNTDQGLLKLYCEASSHYVGIKGGVHSGGSSYTLQLPNALPNVDNQILESNASGTLSWIATPSGGGGGATDLNGLSDVLVDGTSAYFLNIPSSLSGNPTDNLVIGDSAGNSLTTGNSNILLGKNSGNAVTSATASVMIGENAGLGHTTNSASVYIGFDAGKAMNASNAVCIGYRAIRNLGGAYNKHTVVGAQSCGLTTSGNEHTAFGYRTLYFQSSGQRNTAIGYYSLGSGTTFTDNTGLGYEAGRDVTGNGNTILGAYAANSGTNDLTSGSNNILIGHNSAASASTVSNEITLGNSSISTLRCAVTSITSLSDERDKSNIKDLSYGLDFIDSLQPREFVWDNRAETKLQQVKDENGDDVFDENNDNVFEEVEFYSDNKGKKDFGFIAQEVQSLDDNTLRLVYDKNPEKLEISYGKLVPILVKAIQELKAEIDILKS